MFFQLLSAGSEQCVYQWTLNGDLKAKVPCSPTHVFNVSINDKAENTKVIIQLYVMQYTKTQLTILCQGTELMVYIKTVFQK